MSNYRKISISTRSVKYIVNTAKLYFNLPLEMIAIIITTHVHFTQSQGNEKFNYHTDTLWD